MTNSISMTTHSSLFERIKDPMSAITHFIAMIMAILATPPLLLKGSETGNATHVFALFVFLGSMILLYGASATYHTFDRCEKTNRLLRKLDHSMIFVMIAGSYTPVCVITLGGKIGYSLLALIWLIALFGILLKFCWITAPKWLSSVIYITMGWTCLIAIRPILHNLSTPAFLWLLAGGIIYTIGGIIYALKLSIFNRRHKYFGSHEIFHLFVMAGSVCHFIFMYFYVA